MSTSSVSMDHSWYSHKHRAKDLKKSSYSLKRKTYVESQKTTINEANLNLSLVVSTKTISRRVGKKFTAIGLLYKELRRLETKLKQFEILKTLRSKAANEHSM